MNLLCLFVLGGGMCWLLLSYLFVRTLVQLPQEGHDRNADLESRLASLTYSIRSDNALPRMQGIFPEGSCFTLTLYALALENLVLSGSPDEASRKRAIAEVRWSLDQYSLPVVVAPFTWTQVDNGVFWLGQRNLVLGQYLAMLSPAEREPALEAEFHLNSAALHAAFMSSPTAHLDSYPDQCWPADNVTALTSLVVHDRVYGTSYRTAYERWKAWTLQHLDSTTGLPSGHLDAIDGTLFQPARGCANSWILSLITPFDPAFAHEWYDTYRAHFLIRRLGYRVFREYPAGSTFTADVDSGPVIGGAGAVATGVGLGCSRVLGDTAAATDIHGIATAVGLLQRHTNPDRKGTRYLFGSLPVGDAFLAWAYSLPAPFEASQSPTIWELVLSRWQALLVWITLTALLVAAVKRMRRRLEGRSQHEATPHILVALISIAIAASANAAPSVRSVSWDSTSASLPAELGTGQVKLLPLIRLGVSTLPEPMVVQMSGVGGGMLGLSKKEADELQKLLVAYYATLASDPVFKDVPSALSYCYSTTKPARGFATVYVPDSLSSKTNTILFLHGYGGSFLYYLHYLSRLFPDSLIVAPAYGISCAGIPSTYIDEALSCVSKSLGVSVTKPHLVGLSAGGFGAFAEFARRPGNYRALISLAAYAPGNIAETIAKDSTVYVMAGEDESWVTDGTFQKMNQSLRRRVRSYDSLLIPGAGHFFLLTHRKETEAQLKKWIPTPRAGE